MASLVLRTASGIARRTALFTSIRASSHDLGPVPDPQEGKVASDKATMPDTLGHAVGPERFELLAKIAGNEDPFEMNVKRRARGSIDDPTIIPSMFEKRCVGCVCEEDSVSISWMYLYRGEPKRCSCGYWFKMVELNPADYGQK